jgi:hypothetical protein
MTQKGIISYFNGKENVTEDLFVDITLYKIPSDLVREFATRFAYKYSGGISDAVQDLMKKAVTER